jgi:AcrR family transcriptional regulator
MDHLAEQIFDAALIQAREGGWDALALDRVAEGLAIPLSEVSRRFRDADAIADEQFRRLLRAMLADAEEGRAAFAALPPHERATAVLWRWFAAARPDRKVVADMLKVKAWPSHPHTWVPMVFNLSRLIHWVRAAAHLHRGGVARMAEEVGLTAAFLAALATFAADGTEDAARTRRVLEAAVRRVPLG